MVIEFKDVEDLLDFQRKKRKSIYSEKMPNATDDVPQLLIDAANLKRTARFVVSSRRCGFSKTAAGPFANFTPRDI